MSGRGLASAADRLVGLGAVFVAFVIAVAGWQAIATSPLLSEGLVPGVPDVGRALGTLISDGLLWTAIGQTMQGALMGLGLAIAIGMAVGLLIGSSDWLFRVTQTTLEFLRPVPPPALIPVIVLVLGTGTDAKTFLVAFGCIFPIIIAATDGVRDVDPLMLQAAHSFRVARWRAFSAVTLPASLPFAFSGIRLAASMALLVSVAFELIAGSPGLGREINTAANGGQPATMYAFIVVTGLLGVGLNTALLAVQRRVLSWTPAARTVR